MTLPLYWRPAALILVKVMDLLVGSRIALASVGRRPNSTELERRFNHSRNELCISLENERLMVLQKPIMQENDQDVVERFLAEPLKEEPRRNVICIYGMGGLGKTTLARNFYVTLIIVSSFPTRAWICVSQECNTMDILRNIIKSILRCNSFSIMDTILDHVDAIAREMAKANTDLKKLGSDMSTILERFDRVESRRNSHVSTSETLPQIINPPKPLLNDVDISQATKCPPTRDLSRPLLPQFDQV
ncbi:hypothetical protein FXO38_36765 [Capsicum annuum]|nr:hypothetical protein FXO38_36765 [Capsicum annuum]